MQQLAITFHPDRAPIDGQHVTTSGLHGLLFHILGQADQQCCRCQCRHIDTPPSK
ncbi:MAG: hypothetical protein KC418_18730 [Anaerolineales bacterium]|nr:hypothetical protein [Anaerolineales bacterium]